MRLRFGKYVLVAWVINKMKLDELFARRVLKQMHSRHREEIEPYCEPDSSECEEMIKNMEKA